MAGGSSAKRLTGRMAGYVDCWYRSRVPQGGFLGWLRASCRTLLMLVVTSLFTSPALAQSYDDGSFLDLLRGSEIEKRYVYSALYTKHYDPDPDHVDDRNMLGFEFQMRNSNLWGLAMFDNSFGQESQYLYVGRTYRAFQSDNWYYKLTGGLLHGYREPHDDKIPMNDLGVAPAIIPAIGFRHKSYFAEFSQLGLAAGMITAGISF